MAEITPEMTQILKHATGFPRNYRNRFYTGSGSSDFSNCERLVEMGLMAKTADPFDEMSDSFVYRVTDEGKGYLSDRAELGDQE